MLQIISSYLHVQVSVYILFFIDWNLSRHMKTSLGPERVEKEGWLSIGNKNSLSFACS